MSTQMRQFRSRKTGETEWFKPPYPARGDMNWEAVTAPPSILAGGSFAALPALMPAVMPAAPAVPTPAVRTVAQIERVLGIMRGEVTCFDVPPQKPRVMATTADILAAAEKSRRSTDADMKPLTGVAKQIFEAAEKARNLGKK